ncbi:hypothetical protein NKR23_g11842 [Pleurostoma richardsiae]|uniref:Uncharacterized protein n=1 Tax=Pleurostoma richardsiae TaxID=41990 RepID=A0AA38R982_9PEZI|nr:hypothetical protein NKR23_g11842 [Pleurostoma richardsiae]
MRRHLNRRRLITIIITSLWGVPAQDLPETIVGCADLQCPPNAAATSAECLLVNKTFAAIGLARIPTASSSLDGLSWVEGVAVEDDGNTRHFDKTFYLGAPASADLSGTGSCAVFFTQVSEDVTFGDGDSSITQGTCAQAMSAECVSALTTRALNANVSGLASEDACAALQVEFENNLDASCARYATGTQWTGVVTRPLSGGQAAGPITPLENETSNCWPIVPKQDSLSLVLSSTSNVSMTYLARQ